MECREHPGSPAVDRCAGCMEPLCGDCLVTVRGRRYCASCKTMAIGAVAPGAFVLPVLESATEPCPEADEALKYAIVGLFCFGFILEPIAISKALKAQRLIAANPNLSGSGKATAALIIAAVGLGIWVLGLLGRFTAG